MNKFIEFTRRLKGCRLSRPVISTENWPHNGLDEWIVEYGDGDWHGNGNGRANSTAPQELADHLRTTFFIY